MIDAKTWRGMAVDEILDSMDIATRVLKDKGFESPEHVAKALIIVRELTDILIEMARCEG